MLFYIYKVHTYVHYKETAANVIFEGAKVQRYPELSKTRE